VPIDKLAISPKFEKIEAELRNGQSALLWLRRIDDIETPITALAKFGADKFGACLFESVEGGETRGRYSIVAINPDLVFEIIKGKAQISSIDENGVKSAPKIIDKQPIEALREFIKSNELPIPNNLPPPISGVYGYLGYEMVRYFERLPKNTDEPLNLPQAVMTRPTIIIVFDGVKQELLIGTTIRPKAGEDVKSLYDAGIKRLVETCAILDGNCPLKAPKTMEIGEELPQITAHQTPKSYMESVKKAQEYIIAGDIFQVVPSQRFSIDYNGSPLALYRALRRTNPSPFLFMLQMDGFSIIGSSPEILVRLRDGNITLRPIAGTRPRGETPALDKKLEEDLLNDPKEISEHLMLLDLGRNDVGRVSISKPRSNSEPNQLNGGIRVTQKFVVERYSHVMHIVSNVEGTLKPQYDALDALLAGFPAGTVSGAPKIRAMEIISELEPHERGVYAGGVGYFSSGGDMDMCIALRTGVLKDKKLYVQAGAGVVLDSVPQSEHDECVNKAKALIYAAREAKRYEGGPND
jgi:anthranilate synthase component I